MDLRDVAWAVVDVEATGGRAFGGDRIIEVAVIHVRGDKVETAAEFLINPQRPIPPFVSRLTGIHWSMVAEAPTFMDVAPLLHQALAERVFVAHNARFDWRLMSMELERSAGAPLVGMPFCTLKLARKVLSFLPRRSLDALSWHYEVPNPARHRAGGDARATAQILLRMLADLRRQDIDTWDQLQAFLRQPRAPRKRSALPQPVLVEAIA